MAIGLGECEDVPSRDQPTMDSSSVTVKSARNSMSGARLLSCPLSLCMATVSDCDFFETY